MPLPRLAPAGGLREGKVELGSPVPRLGRAGIGDRRAGHQRGPNEVAGAAEELPGRELGAEAGRGRQAVDQEHGCLSRPGSRE
ncbi:MAG TPA: hypothetical protein VGJ75_26350 [Dongiaceae bacterium]